MMESSSEQTIEQNQIEQIKKSLQEAQKHFKQLQEARKSVAEIRASQKNAQDIIESLKVRLEKIQKMAEKAKEELEAARVRSVRKGERNKVLQKEIQACQLWVDRITLRIVQKKGQTGNEEELKTLQGYREEKLEDLAEVSMRGRAAEARLKDELSIVKKAEKKLEKAQTCFTEESRMLEKTQSTFAELDKRLQEDKKFIKQAQQAFLVYQADIDEIKKQLLAEEAKIQAHVEKIKTQLQQDQNLVVKTKKELEAAQMSVKKTSAELAEVKKQIEDEEAWLKDIGQHIEQIKQPSLLIDKFGDQTKVLEREERFFGQTKKFLEDKNSYSAKVSALLKEEKRLLEEKEKQLGEARACAEKTKKEFEDIQLRSVEIKALMQENKKCIEQVWQLLFAHIEEMKKRWKEVQARIVETKKHLEENQKNIESDQKLVVRIQSKIESFQQCLDSYGSIKNKLEKEQAVYEHAQLKFSNNKQVLNYHKAQIERWKQQLDEKELIKIQNQLKEQKKIHEQTIERLQKAIAHSVEMTTQLKEDEKHIEEIKKQLEDEGIQLKDVEEKEKNLSGGNGCIEACAAITPPTNNPPRAQEQQAAPVDHPSIVPFVAEKNINPANTNYPQPNPLSANGSAFFSGDSSTICSSSPSSLLSSSSPPNENANPASDGDAQNGLELLADTSVTFFANLSATTSSLSSSSSSSLSLSSFVSSSSCSSRATVPADALYVNLEPLPVAVDPVTGLRSFRMTMTRCSGRQ